jgi:hypothetical protein
MTERELREKVDEIYRNVLASCHAAMQGEEDQAVSQKQYTLRKLEALIESEKKKEGRVVAGIVSIAFTEALRSAIRARYGTKEGK